MEFDTIAAISTSLGESGISIIRVSGSEAINIVDKIFYGKYKLIEVESHTINYGNIKDQKNNIIDEVLITVMKAPKTFTREDIIEINCHGGVVVTKIVLDIVLENGARLAEPGEFTKRAFLNGRIDLSQAEGIIDLIRSKTDRAQKIAIKQVEGELSNKIKELREIILNSLALIEVKIDYPEHDIVEVTYASLDKYIKEIKNQINFLLVQSEKGKILREGISTAIVGRPNVGKSSILNSLLHENRAIVTDVPGTTRDIIEEYINIKGIPLKIIDTAGIRHTDDVVEKIGVEKSKKVLNDADLILFVLNNNEVLQEEDYSLINILKDRKVIVVINKIDLISNLEEGVIKNKLPNASYIYTSITNSKGIFELEDKIGELFYNAEIESDDLTYISNSRHIDLLNKALISTLEVIQGIELEIPIDILEIDIHHIYDLLGQIIGETSDEDLINKLFSNFCVGK